jgi:hypothetical protein
LGTYACLFGIKPKEKQRIGGIEYLKTNIMKHWTKGREPVGEGNKGIILKQNHQVVSVYKIDGKISITEECDGWYEAEYTKEEALELIEELKQWIEDETI